ncbi:MAG: ABC transporter permease [Prevotella sp.]|nr:ABC transporter permease [Prevotella sp.]
MNNIVKALKNLPRRGQHNLAKIVCLGFGLAVSAVLIGEVYFEQTFDTWFPGHERTYAINEDVVQNGQYNEWSSTSGAVAPGIKAISPQVEAATRYSFMLSDVKTTVDGRPFTIDEVDAADSCLFDVFPRATVQGNLKESLSRPYNCVISRSMADRIGGNVVGKAFELRDYDFKLIIGGVYEDFPYNSKLHGIDVITSLPTINKYLDFEITDRWVGGDRFSSYIRLKKGATIDYLKPNVSKMMAQHSDYAEAKKAGVKFNYSFTQVTEDYISNPQVKTMCWIMSLLAIILLVSTVVNYLLIVMGNVVSRFREMAVRKCFGGGRRTIYGIMVSESLVHVAIGILLAAVLIFACKGTIEGYISAPVSTMLFSRGSWILILICLLIIFVGGFVPGYIYNKVPVTAAFRGVHETRRRWKLIMLSVEFLVVTVMLSLLAVVQQQYREVTHEDMGYDYSCLAVVTLDKAPVNQMQQAVTSLRSLPFIEQVTTAYTLPIGWHSGNNIYLPGDDTEYFNIADQYSVGDGYLKLMGIKVVEGRNFTEPADSDLSEVMVSESFVKRFHTTTHKQGSVVGQHICVSEHTDSLHPFFTICGVYKDVSLGSSLERELRPSVLFHDNNDAQYILAKFTDLTPDNLDRARQQLKRLLPDRDVKVMPYSDLVVNQYQSTDGFRMGTLVTGITALVIALMGLIGYTTDEVNRRRKEIAIRKVNGATARDIFHMLVADVLRLSVPAVIVGLILSWVIAGKWLQLFADRITLSPLLFLAVGLVVLAIVVTIMLLSARKVVNSNPVLFLKDE